MIRQDENDDTKQQNNTRHDRRMKTRPQKLEGNPTGLTQVQEITTQEKITQEKTTQGKTTQGKTDP